MEGCDDRSDPQVERPDRLWPLQGYRSRGAFGKVLLKVVGNRAYVETENLLPEGQRGCGPSRLTIDIMIAMRRLQELGKASQAPLYVCFVDLAGGYYSVDCKLPWKVIARLSVPDKMISIIQQFHDGMGACVRMDDGVCLDWFDVVCLTLYSSTPPSPLYSPCQGDILKRTLG